VFVVGSGVDIPLIKPALEAATSLELSVPDEPEMALARGAALASANAPLFASSTAALAYAQDPVPARWTRCRSPDIYLKPFFARAFRRWRKRRGQRRLQRVRTKTSSLKPQSV